LDLLNQNALGTHYSFTEARVLLDIGFAGQCTASYLVAQLNMDRSYMSRTLKKLEKDGLVTKENSSEDGRTNLIRLTAEGTSLFEEIDQKSDEQVVRLLDRLSEKDIAEVHAAMRTIQEKLSRLEKK
jgi:DNA-binding MarR family transcriptional regulator